MCDTHICIYRERFLFILLSCFSVRNWYKLDDDISSRPNKNIFDFRDTDVTSININSSIECLFALVQRLNNKDIKVFRVRNRDWVNDIQFRQTLIVLCLLFSLSHCVASLPLFICVHFYRMLLCRMNFLF